MAREQPEKLLVDHTIAVLRRTFPGSWWAKNVVAFATLRSGQPAEMGLGEGSSDIVGCVEGYAVYFEAKTPWGTQSKEQKVFEVDINNARGYYRVIRSANEAVRFVNELLEAKRGKSKKIPGDDGGSCGGALRGV